jgi:hypothetical protein
VLRVWFIKSSQAVLVIEHCYWASSVGLKNKEARCGPSDAKPTLATLQSVLARILMMKRLFTFRSTVKGGNLLKHPTHHERHKEFRFSDVPSLARRDASLSEVNHRLDISLLPHQGPCQPIILVDGHGYCPA